MKTLAIFAAVAMLTPSLAWGHSGGMDQYGCHNDSTKGDYHCHSGKLKDRSYKSQETMLKAHPELQSSKKADGERAKKEKAEDKVKDGDKTTTAEYEKDAKKTKK
jgi:hypothetical protein